MDISRRPEIQQSHPMQPNPILTDSHRSFYNAQHPTYLTSYPYYPPNPNPSDLSHYPPKHEIIPSPYEAGPYEAGPSAAISTVQQRLLDPSLPHSYDGQYLYQRQVMPPAAAAAPYYQEPNPQSWVVNEAVQQYALNPPYASVTPAVPPNGMETLTATNPNAMYWSNSMVRPFAKFSAKRGPKKTKIVQSAWCEVCKIDCNSKDVLAQHKLGKKHKKNLEKIQEARKGAAMKTATQGVVKKIGPPTAPIEDLETKRRKIMAGGAAAEEVRMCAICNVVCNSETVFNFHLAGQKHAAQVKKVAEAGGAFVTV